MRTASEKLAIIRLVEESELSVRRTLDEIKVSRTSFYRWYSAYEQGGLDGLASQGRASRRHCNRIPADVYEGRRNDILDQRALVKARTMTKRKIHNLQLAGYTGEATGRKVSLRNRVKRSHKV